MIRPAVSSFASFLNPSSDGSLDLHQEQGVTNLLCRGEWTVHSLQNIEDKLLSLPITTGGVYTVDCSEIKHLDTSGALLLNLFCRQVEQQGGKVRLEGLPEGAASLVRAAKVPETLPAAEKTKFGISTFFEDVGRLTLQHIRTVGADIGFLGQYIAVLTKLIMRPKQMRWTSLVFHMEQVGVRAVPIVSLLTFLIGMVVAYMGAEELGKFGAQVFAVNLLDITVMREMGVLITAIVVAGRSSSAFTAQIGSMVANEEVAAIQALGLSPMELLVIPRVLALTLTLPLLVFLADLMALLGGAAALWYSMDMSIHGFFIQYQSVCNLQHFWVGLVKTPFFAIVIGIVGCYQGFQATTSAESVGFLTTKSVVQSIFFVIVLDALFAVMFTTVGI